MPYCQSAGLSQKPLQQFLVPLRSHWLAVRGAPVGEAGLGLDAEGHGDGESDVSGDLHGGG
ncbi:hypothetical protein ACRE_008770 [Hapsidospora chrysogenum ATCC 11550]|uniref:Uncharacterized protein n=1 Tax=Hapsidospora chrysogenum (strain ATCC 11550 / CBS 779.69 / DSM 880 / IAM 14645 / JCM 23072 / IMI 49137) TaxID=857340 RepID=A0A086TG55_HAPC1|nr:hypothetical protein ACRE_008770 [Hapsidospora chrysogenum ATCC 11550]